MTDRSDSLRVSKPTPFERNMLITAKGGGILAIGSLFEFGSRFVIAFLLARLLGAEQYGLYILAISTASVIAGISALGLDSAMVRYVAILASRRDEAGLWGTLQIGVGISVCVSALMGIGLYFLAYPMAERVFHEPLLVPLLQLLSLVVPFLTLSNALGDVARGFKRMDYSVIAQNFVQLLVRFFLVAVLAVIGLDAFRVAIIFGLSDVAASVVLVYLLNKEFALRRPLRAARHDFREILSFSLPLWLSGLLLKFRKDIQPILLGALSTVTNVGIFTLIDRINLVGRVSYHSIIGSVKPIFAELYARGDWEQMGRLYQTTTRWAVMANLPMFVILVMYPEQVLSIFGTSFANGASALILLAWAELANAITGTCGSIIDMTGHTRLKLMNSVIWVALLLGGNWLLIPQWGVLGAATASLIGMATVNTLRVVEVWFLFRLLPYNMSLVKPLAAGLVALAATLVVGRRFPAEASLLYAGLHVMIIVAVYVGGLVLSGLAPEDRMVLARLSRRANSMVFRSRAVLTRHLMAR